MLPAGLFKLDLAVTLQAARLLHPAAQAREAGLPLSSLSLLSSSLSTLLSLLLPQLTALDKVLPCTG
jgi:hypothetical protein